MIEIFRFQRIKRYVREASFRIAWEYRDPKSESTSEKKSEPLRRFAISGKHPVKSKTDAAAESPAKPKTDTEAKAEDVTSATAPKEDGVTRRSALFGDDFEDMRIQYSEKSKSPDPYSSDASASIMRTVGHLGNPERILGALDKVVNQSFVDKLLSYISQKGVRDSKIYKAAGIDKRLFSKMVSNREYKPSKDTAIALALALELSLEDASDLLSRAGYTLSHSSKRDIIIEYFFIEGAYNIVDLNEVLYTLGQSVIGRA